MLGVNSTRRLRHTKTCKCCGKEFQSSRSDAIFHDQACKKYFKRNGHGYAAGFLNRQATEATRYNPAVPAIPGLLESLEELKEETVIPAVTVGNVTVAQRKARTAAIKKNRGQRGPDSTQKTKPKQAKGTKLPKKGKVKSDSTKKSLRK